MATKFFFCPVCGNVVLKVVDSGIIPHCCGREMIELVPGSTDGDADKHLPVVFCQDGSTVRVEIGSKPHPALPEHHIVLIALETDRGIYLQKVKEGGSAVAEFHLCGKAQACKRGGACGSASEPAPAEIPTAAYCYCNIHGLWKTDIPSSCPSK